MTKCLRFAALLSVIVACKSGEWTKQNIGSSGATGETLLRSIEVRAKRDPRAAPHRPAIKEAIQTARTMPGTRTQQIRQVVAAMNAAQDGNWPQAVRYMNNADPVPPPPEDGCGCASPTQAWPQVECEGGMAEVLLDEIVANAMAGASPQQSQKIQNLVRACKQHATEGRNLTLAQHCDHVLNALRHSLPDPVTGQPPEWTLCIKELEHDVLTGPG